MTIMPQEPSKLTAIGVGLLLFVVAVHTIFTIAPLVQTSIDMYVANPVRPDGWEIVKAMGVIGVIMIIIATLPHSFAGR